MAVKILNGTSPEDIPVETMGGYPIFDQNMLNRFKINEDKIPDDAVIINYVPTFYENYRTVIWPAAFIIIFLIMLIIILILYNRKKNAVKKPMYVTRRMPSI